MRGWLRLKQAQGVSARRQGARLFCMRPQRAASLQAFSVDTMAKRYTILGDRLAKGTYGEVWRAWDEEEERLVALKRQAAKSDDAAREMDAFLASIAGLRALISEEGGRQNPSAKPGEKATKT